MKKTKSIGIRRTGKNLSHLLQLHTNACGEVSPGLATAIKIVGAGCRINFLTSPASDLESGAVLLKGKKHRVIWSPVARLGQIKPLAELLKANWIANWDGVAETKNVHDSLDVRRGNPLDTVSSPRASTWGDAAGTRDQS